MGNHRFKLSYMMPNAWFYKLRDMSKSHKSQKKLPPPPAHKNPRKSYYHPSESRLVHHPISPQNTKFLDTRFPQEPHRGSAKRRTRCKTIYMPSPRQKPANLDSHDGFPTTDDEFDDFFLNRAPFPDSDSSGPGPDHEEHQASPAKDTDTISRQELNLPPIVTKLVKKKSQPSGSERNVGPARKSFSRPGGVKVKFHGKGPRMGCKRLTEKGPRDLGDKRRLFYSESLAIVKASIDPEQDFRQSMVEMIVENNICDSKDLEDLLACYLSLNSNQYHGPIIRAFEQIWFGLMSNNHH